MGVDRPEPASGQTTLPPLEERPPLPFRVALVDQLDGAAAHASQRLNLAVVAKAPLPRMLTFAEERGWRHLQLVSSANKTCNRDYHGETEDGSQVPMLDAFHRDVKPSAASGAWSLPTGRATLDRIIAASARLSRSGSLFT